MMRHFYILAFGILALSGVWAAEVGAPAEPATEVGPGGLDITADRLEYEAQQKLMVGTGNVVVRDGGDELRADYMTVQTETEDVYARGNVVFRREGKIWRGQEFRYNLKTKQGDFGEFIAYSAPYYITAKDSQRISENEYHLKDVTLTTCGGDNPEVAIHAREARLVDGNKLRAKGVVFYAGPVPFFYLPKLNRKLSSHPRYFEVVPGYSSRMGGYLLTAYNYPVADRVRGATHVDYRSKRGFGVGQDFTWDNTNDTINGEFKAYYADDNEPFDSPDEEAEDSGLVDNERYRIKLNHFQSFTPRDYMIADINYLSDPDIIEDFFDDEFRHETQPENRFTLTHRADKFTAGLLLNKRLNDFYENVDRVPELSLSASRQRLGDSGFYYESENYASQLERVFPEDSGLDDYDALRLDTARGLSRHVLLGNAVHRHELRAGAPDQRLRRRDRVDQQAHHGARGRGQRRAQPV
jgi:LPS-assembly protein